MPDCVFIVLYVYFVIWLVQARRKLLQGGEVEGGGSGLAAGCFPDFYSPQDFHNFLLGTYQGMQHSIGDECNSHEQTYAAEWVT